MDQRRRDGFSRRALRSLCSVWRPARPLRTPVKIGVIYPLSGNSASAGNYSKMAIEVGADVINNGNAELAKIMPLAKGGGLPGLGGAKIQLIFADNQGTPAAGQNQALRLISEEKVVALIGAYQSGITLTASAIAERHGIPFLTAESVAANLTERGFKWFFRTTPVAIDFARAYSTSSRSRRRPARRSTSIALVHENTEYGNSVASVIADHVRQGRPARSRRRSPTRPTPPTCSRQVLQLKEKNPDVVIFISYTSDAILYAKTMKELDWKPADHDRRQCRLQRSVLREEPSASSVEGLVNRSSFAVGKPGSVPTLFNELYKKKTGGDELDDVVGARPAGLPGAGRRDQPRRLDRSRQDPGGAEGHRPARPSQMVTGYKGVKFDDKGQNILASSVDHPDAAAARTTSRSGRRTSATTRSRSCPTRAGDVEGAASVPPYRRRRRALIVMTAHVLVLVQVIVERAAARRGLCAVLVRPHPDLGHDERRQLRPRRFRHARHVRRRSWSGRCSAAGRSPRVPVAACCSRRSACVSLFPADPPHHEGADAGADPRHLRAGAVAALFRVLVLRRQLQDAARQRWSAAPSILGGIRFEASRAAGRRRSALAVTLLLHLILTRTALGSRRCWRCRRMRPRRS